MQADEQVADQRDAGAGVEGESVVRRVCGRSRGSVRWCRRRWWRRWATAGPSAAVVRCRLIWGWCLVSPRRGRTKLLGIGKRGDRYTRALLIHGARAVLRTAHKGERTRLKEWALDVKLAGERTWPRWRWPTSWRGSPGRCSGTTRAIATRCTSAIERRRRGPRKRPEAQRTNQGRIAPPSSLRGLERAMARQVGPARRSAWTRAGPIERPSGCKEAGARVLHRGRELERRDSHQQAGYMQATAPNRRKPGKEPLHKRGGPYMRGSSDPLPPKAALTSPPAKPATTLLRPPPLRGSGRWAGQKTRAPRARILSYTPPPASRRYSSSRTHNRSCPHVATDPTRNDGTPQSPRSNNSSRFRSASSRHAGSSR